MKIECNVLLKNLGWFTLIPRKGVIDVPTAMEIGFRLFEMDSNVDRIEFVKICKSSEDRI